jgi:hypothetical protein
MSRGKNQPTTCGGSTPLLICMIVTGIAHAQLIVPKEVPSPASPPSSNHAVSPRDVKDSLGEQTEKSTDRGKDAAASTFADGYFVIGFSTRDRLAAVAESGRRNEANGFQSQVLFSSEWTNLTPGLYIVVYGSYPTKSKANTVLIEIRKRIPDAYIKPSGARRPKADPIPITPHTSPEVQGVNSMRAPVAKGCGAE